MRIIKHQIIYSLFLTLLYSTSCFAVGTTYEGIFQSKSNFNRAPLQNTIFNRDEYDGIGSQVWLTNVFDENGNYIVPPGSTWIWQLFRIADENGNTLNQLLADNVITYQGEIGSCKTQWSTGDCGKVIGWSAWRTYPCAPEGRYSIRVLFNGNLVDQYEFSPSRFKPFISSRASKKIIKPKVTKEDKNAEVTDVQIYIAGVAGKEGQCITPVKNAVVQLANTIVEEGVSVDGHAHFTSNNEIGTGKYIKLLPTDTLEPGSEDTVIEGVTDSDGFYRTKYKAGDFGVRETITIKVKREENGIHDELTLKSKLTPVPGEKSNTYTLDIKAPNLVEMPLGDGEFKFVFGGSCEHLPTARWVIPSMKSRLVLLDSIYKFKFGHRLSFNDASLRYGGVIDNSTGTETNPKLGGRESICHVSHLRGVDIDLNKVDEGGINIREEKYLINGIDIKRIGYVTNLAQSLKLKKIDEKGGYIHYRHSSY